MDLISRVCDCHVPLFFFTVAQPRRLCFFLHSHQPSSGLSSQFKRTVTLVPNEPSYRPIFCRRGAPKMRYSHTICAHQFCCYQWGLPLSCLSSHSLNGTVVSLSARRNGRRSFWSSRRIIFLLVLLLSQAVRLVVVLVLSCTSLFLARHNEPSFVLGY